MRRLPAEVRSQRLLMRLWRVGDGAALSAAIGESLEHLRPWMPWIGFEPQTVEQREAWIADCRRQWEDGADATFGVFLLSTGQVVGGTGLHRRGAPDQLDVGYWLHPAHTGKGLATEMTAALTGAALAEPGIARVVVLHDRANARSGGVPRRLGFTMEGESPRALTAPGESGIAVSWAVTAAEWDTGAGRRRGTMGTWPSSSSSTDPT